MPGLVREGTSPGRIAQTDNGLFPRFIPRASPAYKSLQVRSMFTECRRGLFRSLCAIDHALDLGPSRIELSGDEFVLVLQGLYIRLRIFDDAHRLVAVADGFAP